MNRLASLMHALTYLGLASGAVAFSWMILARVEMTVVGKTLCVCLSGLTLAWVWTQLRIWRLAILVDTGGPHPESESAVEALARRATRISLALVLVVVLLAGGVVAGYV
jgi:hypothetical protein